MVPKVLVSDKLSETAIKIFKNKGIEVDFMPEVGKDKEPQQRYRPQHPIPITQIPTQRVPLW